MVNGLTGREVKQLHELLLKCNDVQAHNFYLILCARLNADEKSTATYALDDEYSR